MVSPVTGISYLIPVDIDSGASLSDGHNLGGHVICGVYVPAGWTTAGITMQASQDGINWSNVFLDGTEYTINGDAGAYVILDGANFFGIRHVKLRSGTSGVPVNQAAARSLGLMVGRPT